MHNYYSLRDLDSKLIEILTIIQDINYHNAARYLDDVQYRGLDLFIKNITKEMSYLHDSLIRSPGGIQNWR